MTLAKTANSNAEILAKVVIEGDLSNLSAEDQVRYYLTVCQTLGLNPATKPFAYLRLNHSEKVDGQWRTVSKLVLYALRDATDQLRRVNGISITISTRELIEEIYVVTAKASDSAGRTDESIGAVSVKGLAGEALANAFMKAETKAKRRVTLSIGGLGWLDETEIDSVPSAQRVEVDGATGEVLKPSPPSPSPLPQPTSVTPPQSALSAVAITFDQLKAEVEASGMTWAAFEMEVLGNKTWATFIKTKGASASVAKARWETWKAKQPQPAEAEEEEEKQENGGNP